MKRYAFTDSLRKFLEAITAAAAQTVAERAKLSYARDTLSVLGHTGAVIAVCILFHRVTKYVLYRFKVTGSLHFLPSIGSLSTYKEPTGQPGLEKVHI